MYVEVLEERVVRLPNGTELVDREADGLFLRRVDLDAAGMVKRVHSVPVDPVQLNAALKLMDEE